MKVLLNDKYAVEIEKYNHILKAKKEPKLKDDGTFTKPEDLVVGYYKDMPRAVLGAIKHAQSNNDDTLLFEEYLRDIKSLLSEFNPNN